MTHVIDKYEILAELGEGMFGKVFLSKNINTSEEVAIKLDKSILLKNEARIYQILAGLVGIPKLRNFGVHQGYNYMVIDRLGESLEEKIESTKEPFDLYTTLVIGMQMLDIIKNVHSKNIIHRDLKPANIMISTNKKKKLVYLIDFGLSKLYKISNKHIPCKTDGSLIGTQNYVSEYVHEGFTPSRRDDLISFAYIMIYLLSGSLPWSEMKSEKEVCTSKKSFNLWDLTKIPGEMITILNYCKGLEYCEDPNYEYINILLDNLYKLKSYTHHNHMCWDR